jgi:hypothetical protein
MQGKGSMGMSYHQQKLLDTAGAEPDTIEKNIVIVL